MLQICNFDKVRDVQEHVPSLATDLNQAIETNTVQDTGVVADFNYTRPVITSGSSM